MRLGALLVVVLLLSTACGNADPVLVTGGATRPLVLTPAASTPGVDRDTASVDLDRVVFDTFGRGPRFSLETGRSALIADFFDAIAPIDAPVYETADSASWLAPEDLVVGYVDPDEGAWAYAVRMLNLHEIVNDELGGLPVVVTYCPLCGSGVVYERALDGTNLTFSNTSALYENDMVMVDRETGSYWWQVAGEAIVGTLTGSQLKPVASQTTTWKTWRNKHPDSAVMARLPGRDYSRDSFVNYGEVLDSGRTPFPVSEGILEDDRLPSSARVIVATVGDETKAWPAAPARTHEDTVGTISVTVALDGVGGTVTAASGEELPTRSAFWFSALSAYPDIVIGR